jgi:hypothetical protein
MAAGTSYLRYDRDIEHGALQFRIAEDILGHLGSVKGDLDIVYEGLEADTVLYR